MKILSEASLRPPSERRRKKDQSNSRGVLGVVFLIATLLGVFLVVSVALQLRKLTRFKEWPYRRLFVLSHTGLIIIFVLMFPLQVLLLEPSPYGDIYWLFFVVPGIHIYWPLKVGAQWLAPSVIAVSGIGDYAAGIVVVVLAPAVGACFLGGGLWYLCGALCDVVQSRYREQKAS
jgi:hypothetical protein